MHYVDGYVLRVQKKKFNAYKEMALDAGKIWMKYGALQLFECAGDDMKVPKEMGSGLSFPKIMKAKKDEIVFFSFVIYKSKKQRDSVNKKVHAYMQKKYGDHVDDEEMPFDMKSFVYGGFNVVVDL